MKIDMALAVFNNLEWTKRFVESLYVSTHTDFQLYIANNGSTDQTKDWLRSLSKDNLHLINLDKNYGCAVGWNRAIRAGSNKLVVLTQNDIMFSKDWDVPLLEFLEQYPEQSAAGSGEIPDIRLTQDELNRLVQSLPCEKDHIFWQSFYIPNVLMRRSMYEDVGGFDERFRGGLFEDTDFIRTAQNRGHKYAQVFGSMVSHVHGQTSKHHHAYGPNQRYFQAKWKNGEILPAAQPYEVRPSEAQALWSRGKLRSDVLREHLQRLNVSHKIA